MFIHWSWHNEPVIKLLDLNQKWVWRMDNVWRKEKWQHSSKPVGGVYRITVGIFGMVYQHQWYVIRTQEWRSICHRMVALYFFNIFFLYVLFRCLPLYTFVVLVRQPREKKKEKNFVSWTELLRSHFRIVLFLLLLFFVVFRFGILMVAMVTNVKAMICGDLEHQCAKTMYRCWERWWHEPFGGTHTPNMHLPNPGGWSKYKRTKRANKKKNKLRSGVAWIKQQQPEQQKSLVSVVVVRFCRRL